MIIVDRALEERERQQNPIRVALVGAGFMGRGIVLQITSAVPGMEVVAIYNRNLEGAARAFKDAGIDEFSYICDSHALEDHIARRGRAITDDPDVICEAENIDAIIEATGTVEFGAAVVLAAIRNGKHTILMNAELDGSLGPVLKYHADQAGVVFTNAEGDQPGVIMNLYRFVKGLGIRPVLCGNIKGLHDPYRTPDTQAEFAARWKQKAHMVTAFADGTKISFEQAIVANATGMRVAKRGMHGPSVPAGTPIREAIDWYPSDDLMSGNGIVDYVVGAEPAPGVFVLGQQEDPTQRHYLELYKLGKGPLYCFYAPYHLCHFEVPNTVARAVLFSDAAIAPQNAPMVEVVATAKTDLKAGQVLDGIGFFMTYGQAENAPVMQREQLLPMGLAEGCTLKRDIARDECIRRNDVDLPPGRLSDRLRAEQDVLINSPESN